MQRTCLALLGLSLALTACQRNLPSADANASAPQAMGPNRLMPRGGDRRERADAEGKERVRCKEAVASIPCAP